jgi:hypothetical protein
VSEAGQAGRRRPERPDPEAMAELLSRMAVMGETGLFVMLTYDPQTKGYIAIGEPVDGPTAAVLAGERRTMLDRGQLEDVQVLIVPWVPADEG